jgi:hypothetical protein
MMGIDARSGQTEVAATIIQSSGEQCAELGSGGSKFILRLTAGFRAIPRVSAKNELLTT